MNINPSVAARERVASLVHVLARPLLICAALLVVWSTVFAPAASAADDAYAPAPAPPRGAEVVYLGIQPISFDSIDVSSGDFATSFYVWWRWKGPIDPVPSTDIYNSTEAESHYVLTYSYTDKSGNETPIKLANGYEYQTAKVATGVSALFPVGRYPLDTQDLTLRIENNTYDFDQLVYVADTANMSRTPEFEVAGWNVKGVSTEGLLHNYTTNFGITGQGDAQNQYSQLTYTVQVDRPVGHFIWKLLLPMIAVLLVVLGALFVMEDKTDVRLILVGTGLLTLIFLQQSYGGDLPATSPAVLLDMIYVAAYAAVALTFVRVIYTANMIHHHENDRHNYIKGDRIACAVIGSAFIVALVTLIAS